MKFTFDLFHGDEPPSKDFVGWVPKWWYRSKGLPIEKGVLPSGDEWLLVGWFFGNKDSADVVKNFVANRDVETLFKTDGQFVLVIYSRRGESIDIYRDRTGVLPIAYAQGINGLGISIWIENVILLAGLKPSFSHNIFEDFPLYRIKMAPDTLVEGVKTLSARCSLEISKGTISTREYPMIFPESEPFTTLTSASETLGEILSEAVKKRVNTFKTVGAWLSGGNDSSLLVALAREHHSGDIKTVFVTFEDYQRNYGKFARDVATRFETDHFEINVSPREYLNLWAETIKIIQEPINSPGTIGQAAALEQLSLSVDAMLIGEGADTVFGGPYWAPMLFLSQFGNILPRFVRKPLLNLSSMIKQKSFLFKGIAKSAKALGTPLRDYIHSEITFADNDSIDHIFGSGTWQKSADKFQKEITGNIFDSLFLYLMLDWLPFYNAALRRLGFYFGLVYVFPFVDYELMRNSLRLPKHIRYHYATKKASLKKYALKYFDKQFIHKPKEGFGVPLGKWSALPDFEQFLNLPLEARSLRRKWWDENELKKIIDLHKSGLGTDKSAESIPWIATNLELWARICLEGDSPGAYKVS